MTWSITRSTVVGGDAIVRWSGQPLRQLSDAEFAQATEAASALGEVVLMDATEIKPGLEFDAARADMIVLAVMKEMARRDGGKPAHANDEHAEGTA